MERYQEAIENAKVKIQIADHMLGTTYPMLKDTKLLLAIFENTFLAMASAMLSILYLDYFNRRIDSVAESFEGKLNAFKLNCVNYHGIDKGYAGDIQEMRSLIIEHKKSPVAFVRKDTFVICNESYQIRTLSIADIKCYLSKAKLFIQEAEHIIEKNGRQSE